MIIPLSLLPAGIVCVVFDNSSPPLTKNRAKELTYKAFCDASTHAEFSMSISISRKQSYSLPIVLHRSKVATINFDTPVEILFSIFFEPVGQAKKVICPPTKFSSLQQSVFESIDTTEMDGTLTLTWDNTASIVSSRNVALHILVTY